MDFFTPQGLTFFLNNIEDGLYKFYIFLIWFSNLIFDDWVIIKDQLILIFYKKNKIKMLNTFITKSIQIVSEAKKEDKNNGMTSTSLVVYNPFN